MPEIQFYPSTLKRIELSYLSADLIAIYKNSDKILAFFTMVSDWKANHQGDAND